MKFFPPEFYFGFSRFKKKNERRKNLDETQMPNLPGTNGNNNFPMRSTKTEVCVPIV